MSIVTNGRIPIIPLPYEYKNMAVKRELIIDEKEGKLYLVSSEDESKLIDITQSVADHIKELEGEIVYVTIEGVGTVNIEEFLNIINKKIESSVQLQDITEVKYVAQTKNIDERSLQKHFNKIQITGFATAPNRTIPMKKDNKIEWVNIYGLDGDNDVDSSIDSCYGNVYEIIPQNRVLYPIISKRQKTTNLIEDCKVILPTPLSDYCSIEWYFVIGGVVPKLAFSENILFKNLDEIKPNNKYVFSFKTFDGGDTWLGSVDCFNTLKRSDYYTKDEVDEKLQWTYISGDNKQ